MKKVTEIQQGILNHIFEKLGTIQNIEAQIRDCLPCELKTACRVANFENGILVFAVRDSALGNKLRFSLPALLSTLRTTGGLPQLASIRYYIEPEFDRLFKN